MGDHDAYLSCFFIMLLHWGYFSVGRLNSDIVDVRRYPDFAKDDLIRGEGLLLNKDWSILEQ